VVGEAMKYDLARQQVPCLTEKGIEPSGLGPLEVNVLFTDVDATRAALQAATRLATDLNAFIRIRATIVVPFALPLDHPQVAIPFMEKVLSGLVSEFEQNSLDITAHLYLSRSRVETFLQILPPKSLAVIASRKRPWPTPESWIARSLQSGGHRVVIVSLERGNAERASVGALRLAR
jgi:hypothetical protein